MSGPSFTEGIEKLDVEGMVVPEFGAAKTVADCFKFRRRVGLDVAIEALKDYRRSDGFDAEALWHYAAVCRVTTVMRPYLEALV